MTRTVPLLLANAQTIDAPEPIDVLVVGSEVAAIGEAARRHPGADRVEVHDCAGQLLMPAAVEPHAHLDKALLVDRAPNRTGDLDGAIAANREIYPSLTSENIQSRALDSLDTAVRHGYGAVRSHANLEPGVGTAAVSALLDVGRCVSDVIDLQVVALAGGSIAEPDQGAARALMLDAVELGVHVVGGAPSIGARPDRSVRWLVDCAADAGLPVDLHLDETLSPDSRAIRSFIDAVERCGLGGRAVASHCVSLGQQPRGEILEIGRALASAGISVVTLPQTNLGLQGRGVVSGVPRALPPVQALREAGVNVAAGGDNWRDMFNPLGRIDPFETAALMVAAAHLSMADAWASVSAAARAAIGLAAQRIEPGQTADLIAVHTNSLAEAIAAAPPERTVIHRGELVAQTTTHISRGFSWGSHQPSTI